MNDYSIQTDTHDLPAPANHNLPAPVNHIFVDYENVREVDLAIIGSKTVHLYLLLGAQKTRLDVSLVEKLLQHAASAELIRLKSSGRNALDFALAYYLGRAVLADPGGYFHLVSKDGGYDPLIEHLRSKHIRVRRHVDFTAFNFSVPTKLTAASSPVATPTTKPLEKPMTLPKPLEPVEVRVLKYLRSKPSTKRARTSKKLVLDLVTHLGKKISAAEASALVEWLNQAGHLAIDDKDTVTYHLDQA